MLSLGVLASAICFVIAGVLEAMGRGVVQGSMTDASALVGDVLAFRAWAWAGLGTLAILATPVLSLLVTAMEYAAVDDRLTSRLAITVLGVLGLSLVIAAVR